MEEKDSVNLHVATQELDNPPSPTNISDLTDDCLIFIFQQLSILDRLRLERVCKRWQALIKESWRNVNSLFENEDWGFKEQSDLFTLSSRNLKKVLSRCGRYMLEINIDESMRISGPNVLSTISRYCPNIEHVSAWYVRLNPDSIRDLAERCSKIVKISLGDCTSECDEALALLFWRNRKLRSVRISDNSKVTGECLSALSDDIKTIRFVECKNISMKHFGVLQNFKNLKNLHIDFLSINGIETAESISECFQRLKKFAMNYGRICPFSAIQIAKLKNIEKLDLGLNTSITDDLLVAVSNHCKFLKVVVINGCVAVTNRGLAGILALPSLEYLHAACLHNINDSVFNCSPELRFLSCSKCSNIRDEGIARLIKNSHKIEDIRLIECEEISNVLIRDAIKYTKKRKNSIVLNLHVNKCKVKLDEITETSPLLKVIFHTDNFML